MALAVGESAEQNARFAPRRGRRVFLVPTSSRYCLFGSSVAAPERENHGRR